MAEVGVQLYGLQISKGSFGRRKSSALMLKLQSLKITAVKRMSWMSYGER